MTLPRRLLPWASLLPAVALAWLWMRSLCFANDLTIDLDGARLSFWMWRGAVHFGYDILPGLPPSGYRFNQGWGIHDDGREPVSGFNISFGRYTTTAVIGGG